MENIALRIVISKEDDMFVAQCLEHDISVQAPDIATLEQRLQETIAFEAADGDLQNVPAAPEEFHHLWHAGMGLDAHLPNAEVRLAA